jgi:hypothetical protein
MEEGELVQERRVKSSRYGDDRMGEYSGRERVP